MNIPDAIDEYLGYKRQTIATKTYKWYTYHLERFQSWCVEKNLLDLSDIGLNSVQDALQSYKAPSTYSKHGYGQVVKSFLQYCFDEDLGVRDRLVHRIKIASSDISDVDLFTPEDIEKLLKLSKLMPYPHRTKAIVHILFDTGIRAAELCADPSRPEERTGLLLQDIHLNRDENYLRVMGKGRKERTVGFGVETSSAIRRYLDKERPKTDLEYLLISRKHTPLSTNQLNHLIHDLGEASNIPNCYPHRFRHTFAVNQLINGTSDLVLMQLMGHSSLESTKIYTRAMTELQAARAGTSMMDKLRKSK